MPDGAQSFFANLDNLNDPLSMLKALAIHAPIGVQIYDAKGYTIFCNDQFSKIFGAPPPPGYCVLQDEHAINTGVITLMRRAFAGEMGISLPLTWYDPLAIRNLSPEEYEYLQKNCKKAAIETHLVPVKDPEGKVTHVFYLFKDVTAELQIQEKQEQTLRERDHAKAQFQSLLENTKAVVYIKDLEGKYLFVNEQYLQIFGITSEDILGKTDHDLFPAEVADGFRENDFQVLATKAHMEAEEMAVHKDGSPHTYISLKFPLMDTEGMPYGLCGISTDITEYRRMERELSTAKRMEAVGLLAGGIAHDFNNILGIILMVADTITMQDSVAKPDLHKSMNIVKDAGQRAAALTRSLLTFGRRQKFQPRVMDLALSLREMESMLVKALGEGIRFRLEAQEDLWRVNAHPVQMDQIFTNLAFNSRDAMPQGGTLSIKARNTTLMPGKKSWKADKLSGDFVEVRVTDTGSGIEPGILDRIYEPFFTTKQDGLRSGLGLATVYGIVHDIGGEIRVESKPGQGATFILYFPRSTGAISQGSVRPAKVSESLRGSETILMVEDQEVLRGITATLLRERGYTVHEARNGAAALELWPSIAASTNLIMTDIVMPGMNGLELVKKLQDPAQSKGIKVLFVSGYSQKKLSEYGFDREELQLFEKPYGANDLLAKIRDVLDS